MLENAEKCEVLKRSYLDLGGEIVEFKKIEESINVGSELHFEKRIADIDLFLFGLISGDFNPIHFDDKVAEKTKFGKRVSHGMLTTSLVSTTVAKIPGTVVLLETYFKYLAPVYVNDVVKVSGKVVEKQGNRYKIKIACKVNGRDVVKGWVKILIW